MNDLIRKITKKIVLLIFRLTDFSYIDEVYDPEMKTNVKRWVLMIPGGGCQWAKQTGGCYMCGFKHQTERLKGKKDKPPKFKMKLAYHLGRYFANVRNEKPHIVAIYNGGSFLNDNEVPVNIQEDLFRMIIKDYPMIKKILIESRPEYIDIDRIRALKSIIGGKRELSIGIGLECKSDHIRQHYINKGFSLTDYESAVKSLKQEGVKILTYVFLKPIGITERWSIEEAIRTIKYALSMGDEVALQSAFIQKGTVMCKLYKSGKFSPPWLWSIIYVIKQCAHLGPIHIGSFNDEPAPLAVPKNCGDCDERVLKAISHYNRTHDTSVFDNIRCLCKDIWRSEVMEKVITAKAIV